MKPIVEAEFKAKEAKRIADAFRSVIGTEQWSLLVNYLEDRYVALMGKDCDSVKSLASRNGALVEIRGIFEMIGHELSMEGVARRQFKELKRAVEESPTEETQDDIVF